MGSMWRSKWQREQLGRWEEAVTRADQYASKKLVCSSWREANKKAGGRKQQLSSGFGSSLARDCGLMQPWPRLLSYFVVFDGSDID